MPLFEGSSGDDEEEEEGAEGGHEVSGRGKKGSGGSGSGGGVGMGVVLTNGTWQKEGVFGEPWLLNHNALDAALGPSLNPGMQLARYASDLPSSLPHCTAHFGLQSAVCNQSFSSQPRMSWFAAAFCL